MNDRYRLHCGHTLTEPFPSASRLHVGAPTWCPFCSGPSAVMGVEMADGSPYAPPPPAAPPAPTPVNDAIVDMVFDAIATTRMSSEQRATLPIDLSVGVKKRFRDVMQRMGGGPPKDAKQPVDTGVPQAFTESEACATMCLLLDYLNTPEGLKAYGAEGDSNGWSTGETAVRGLKSAARLASVCSANTGTIDRLTRENLGLLLSLGKSNDEVRREKSYRCEAFVTLRLRDEKITKYEKLLVEIKEKMMRSEDEHLRVRAAINEALK